MPYRAMFITLLTVGIALVVVSMWVRAVTPVLAQAQASTQVAAVPLPSQTRPATAPATTTPADKSVRKIIKGTMTLSFTLICLLLVVGIFASMREWIRYRALRPIVRGGNKTKYVDVWKIAGERAKVDPPDENAPPKEDPEL